MEKRDNVKVFAKSYLTRNAPRNCVLVRQAQAVRRRPRLVNLRTAERRREGLRDNNNAHLVAARWRRAETTHLDRGASMQARRHGTRCCSASTQARHQRTDNADLHLAKRALRVGATRRPSRAQRLQSMA